MPALSFVIPLYNSESTIAGLVRAIASLEVAGGHEIVLVNDGSRDRTSEICRELARKSSRVSDRGSGTFEEISASTTRC